jgi:signal transduction histidine kinase
VRCDFTPFQIREGYKVYSDSNRLQQVILNLLSNALKFTDEYGTITISCGPFEKEGQKYLQVSVEDTGTGISKEDQKKMFKLFGFLDSSKARNSGGIGLGLFISAQIVKEFEGGIIDLDSEPGEGSKFTFKFKLD